MNATEATKKVRRDHARELAREMREDEKKRKRRNRFFVQGGVVVGLLAIIAIVALVIVNTKPTPIAAGPLNMISDGILLKGENGSIVPVKTAAIVKSGKPVSTDPNSLPDTVNIVMYIDYFCPSCQAFESTNQTQIDTLLSSGVATLEVHPIQLLDRSSVGTRYSSRAANAGACVANYQPDKFLDVTAAFYANQPKEGTGGLTNDQIVQLVQSAGAKRTDVKKCIAKELFKDWVAASTARAFSGELPNSNGVTITGTPTVLVDGQEFTGLLNDPSAFISFFNSIASAKK